MPGTRGETCAGCRFWLHTGDDDDDRMGDCRRHAPRAALQAQVADDRLDDWDENYALWPLTFGTEWCGEWEAR
jgi:NADH:ubiquinone oxidoreductase subunit B-like Fe-S oxidoreductase